MRFLFFVLVPILAALGFLLAPRPFIKPDWRTPYEAAVDAGDCETIERIVDALNLSGFEYEAYKQEYANYKAGRCRFADLPANYAEALEITTDVKEWRPWSKYRYEGFRSSRFGRIYRMATRETFPANRLVREAERELFKTWLDSCEAKTPRGIGGRTNYNLLAFALENNELSVEEIYKIAREQRAACAARIIGQAKIIASASATPEEFAILPQTLWLASIFEKETPELGPDIEEIASVIPDEAYRIVGWMREDDRLASFECEARYGDRVLAGAIECAAAADEAVGERKNADAYALYYARRAERLGWRDLSAIEARARARLTPECAAAVVAAEEAEAEGADDPRDYETRQLRTVTMKEGGPCAAGEEGPTASGQE